MKTLEEQCQDAFEAYLSAVRYGNEGLVRATKLRFDQLSAEKNGKKLQLFFKIV